eukprot:TRINITY_DN3202_c0_g2_i1.p1 TRINITY_DN3202_c0_g2~~TRINITY_DN3202_c0_g2_i1.p1  ORF type:complete len:336 (+),score=88.20 TRINITY_DN3202_c0_g2_i1:55-1008(+)
MSRQQATLLRKICSVQSIAFLSDQAERSGRDVTPRRLLVEIMAMKRTMDTSEFVVKLKQCIENLKECVGERRAAETKTIVADVLRNFHREIEALHDAPVEGEEDHPGNIDWDTAPGQLEFDALLKLPSQIDNDAVVALKQFNQLPEMLGSAATFVVLQQEVKSTPSMSLELFYRKALKSLANSRDTAQRIAPELYHGVFRATEPIANHLQEIYKILHGRANRLTVIPPPLCPPVPVYTPLRKVGCGFPSVALQRVKRQTFVFGKGRGGKKQGGKILKGYKVHGEPSLRKAVLQHYTQKEQPLSELAVALTGCACANI